VSVTRQDRAPGDLGFWLRFHCAPVLTRSVLVAGQAAVAAQAFPATANWDTWTSTKSTVALVFS